jgi:phosphatidylserine/phosphatidylglycerophosphate/cardiolipin synthase-like enzyme/uncharacterized membrane protein YdjX (TVP38/TMEM64 family)
MRVSPDSILIPGQTCWVKKSADRFALLVDAQSYFQAFVEAVTLAQESILILSWDISPRIRLLPNESDSGLKVQLGPFLVEQLAQKPRLRVHILAWDFASLFAFEREVFFFSMGRWPTHPRLNLRFDNTVPFGASHHQKIIVLDDRVAFVGGLDLTARRWDTPQHLEQDPRRRDINNRSYDPFHDLQAVLDGQAARSLADIARERWFRATHLDIPYTSQNLPDPWPKSVLPDMKRVNVGIARTYPTYKTYKEVREVELLYLRSIAAAKAFIYIENQYFTSDKIFKALLASLKNPRGPEVVLVVPYKFTTWISNQTMGVLRNQALAQLQRADLFDRFDVFYAVHGATPINIHSKLMVVDNRFLRMGSSNINNRSMGFDSECDVAIESEGSSEVEAQIKQLKFKLLSEHLSTPWQELEATFQQTGSLIQTVRSHLGKNKTLRPFEGRPIQAVLRYYVPAVEVLDPEIPLERPDRSFAAAILPQRFTHFAQQTFLPAGLALTFLAWWAGWGQWALPEAWQWTRQGIQQFSTYAPLEIRAASMVGIFMLGGLLLVPTSLLVMASVISLGTVSGLLFSLAGLYLMAMGTYRVGSWVPAKWVNRLVGKPIERLKDKLSRFGILTVVTLRMLPLTPFTLENLVAGNARIRKPIFRLGTLIGMTPGIKAMTLFTHLWVQCHLEPSGVHQGWLLGFTVFFLFSLNRVRAWFRE